MLIKVLRRNTTAVAVMLAASISLCPPAHAQFTFDWTNPGGGSYAAAGNWSSIVGGVPDSSDDVARFQLNATYSVAIDSDYTVHSLVARQQGNVTLAFAPPSGFPPTPVKVYNAGQLLIDPTENGTLALALNGGDVRISGDTFIGGASSSGQANLQLNTQLSTASAQVGNGAMSTGNVAVGYRNSWSSSGPLVLGGSGNASLDIDAHYVSNCFIGCVSLPAQGRVTSSGVTMADGPQSDATATVYGIWNTGNLVVGDQGEAEITVLGTTLLTPQFINVSSVGMLDSADVSIGAQPGSSGNVRIAGIAFGLLSDWDVTGSMAIGGTIGSAGGQGRLSIAQLNQVSVGGNLRMWSGGVLAMNEDGILEVTGAANLGGTLEFVLTQTPNPQLNDTFQILTAGSIAGAFTSTILPPLDAGLRWSVQYGATSVSLNVLQGLTGDYNGDGVVNAADYTVWRDTLGSTTNLAADGNNSDTVEAADHQVWKQNFGRTSAAGSAAPVPEPAGFFLAVVLLAAAALYGFVAIGQRTITVRPLSGPASLRDIGPLASE